MASILVTGAAGFIGSHVCRTLLNEGHVVYGVDNFITGTRANVETLAKDGRFTFFEMDIANPAFVTLFEATPIDFIFHLACPTGVPNLRTLATEMLMTCSYGMFNVLEVAKQHHSRVLFTSTAEVYGQPEKFPQDEMYFGNVNSLGERSAYEEGKRFSEAVLAMYDRRRNLDARVVRVFNTYGPGMTLEDQRVIPQFIKSVGRHEPLRVYGDGSQTRCHLYINDLVAGLQLVMQNGRPGEAYNVGSETPLSVRELAELIINLTGHRAGIQYQPHFIEDHRHRLPSVEKAKLLGWQQKIHISDGLKAMIDTYLVRGNDSERELVFAEKVATPV